MTPTIVIFRGKRHPFSSEKAAYLWLIEQLLRIKPDLLRDPNLHRKGGRSRPLFSRSPIGMKDWVRLANDWYVNTNLSNPEKVKILDNLTECAGLKRGRDWDWQAGSQPTPKYIDGDALLAELKAF